MAGWSGGEEVSLKESCNFYGNWAMRKQNWKKGPPFSKSAIFQKWVASDIKLDEFYSNNNVIFQTYD